MRIERNPNPSEVQTFFEVGAVCLGMTGLFWSYMTEGVDNVRFINRFAKTLAVSSQIIFVCSSEITALMYPLLYPNSSAASSRSASIYPQV